MNQRVCPQCNQSVGTIKVQEKDPKTLKYWLVEKCFKCHFNFELEESTRELDRTQRIAEWNKRFGIMHPRPPDGGWPT